MRDLKNPNLIKLKGLLFLFLGLFAGVLLILESPKISTALLLLICIWSFCRAYYFVFYVIEHYVDKEFRFAGLIDFFKYLMTKRQKSESP